MARGVCHTQPAHGLATSQTGARSTNTEIIDTLRTLAGAAPLQMPASIDLVTDPELKDRFERWWGTALAGARPAQALQSWVGPDRSEFAGRHMLYERFYAGNSIIVRNQSDREAPWETFHATVDGLLGAGGGATRKQGVAHGAFHRRRTHTGATSVSYHIHSVKQPRRTGSNGRTSSFSRRDRPSFDQLPAVRGGRSADRRPVLAKAPVGRRVTKKTTHRSCVTRRAGRLRGAPRPLAFRGCVSWRWTLMTVVHKCIDFAAASGPWSPCVMAFHLRCYLCEVKVAPPSR